MNSLLYAARPLISDFFPTIIFAVLTAMKVDVVVATSLALAIGIGQVLVQKLRRQPIELLQWASLGLVMVFGTVSILTKDPRFLMAKPSIIYLAVAAVMLKRGWMMRYLPPIADGRGEPAMVAFGYAWAGLMALTALANLVVAVAFTSLWPAFIAIFPLASKIVLFGVQYVTVRAFVKRQMLAEQAQIPPQAQAA